jgi:hypothetical protein
MGFRYTLATRDGDIFGEGEWGFTPQAGDELILSGGRRVRVTAVVPAERIEEFTSRPLYGLLEVEPA